MGYSQEVAAGGAFVGGESFEVLERDVEEVVEGGGGAQA